MAIIGLVAIALMFFLISYLVREHDSTLRAIIGREKIVGMATYILFGALAVVIAPISTLPLIPLASNLWGWVATGILSILGWLLGAEIAFLLARHYGKPLVQKLVSIEKLEKMGKEIPEHHLFLTVVFLRMFVSVDILSYALGLFSNMRNVSYITATAIGITPFAFIFAYTVTLSFLYQVLTLGLASSITLGWLIYRRRAYKNS